MRRRRCGIARRPGIDRGDGEGGPLTGRRESDGLGVGSQLADRPDNGVDNVDAPLDEPGQVRGSHSGRVLRHSAFTRLVARRPRPGDVVTAGLTALRRGGGSTGR